MFVRDFSDPYGLQNLGKDWLTINKKLPDPMIKNHLDKKLWIAVKAGWYVEYGILDVDGSTEQYDSSVEDRCEEAIDVLQLKDENFQIMTSPSFEKDGSLHIVLKLEQNEIPPTQYQAYHFLHQKVGHLCEIYPQKNRKFRLPFGLKQHLYDREENLVLKHLKWYEAMNFLTKLEPIFVHKVKQKNNKKKHTHFNKNTDSEYVFFNKKAEELLSHGLHNHRSRHFAQYQLISYFYRQNRHPNDVKKIVFDWIKSHHNGKSKEINNSNFEKVREEVERQTDYVYADNQSKRIYPNIVFNNLYATTEEDLLFIAKAFKGDTINQKRLFKLMSYCRPRRHHKEIFIPFHVWEKIAHKKHYHRFLEILEEKDFIASDMIFLHLPNSPAKSFCRKFEVKLPFPQGKILTDKSGRNISEFYTAWSSTGRTVEDIIAITGVSQPTLDRHIKQVCD